METKSETLFQKGKRERTQKREWMGVRETKKTRYGWKDVKIRTR